MFWNKKLNSEITELKKENNEIKSFLNSISENEKWWQPIGGLNYYDNISQDVYRSFAYACIHKGAMNFAKGQPYVYRKQRKSKVEIEEHPFLQLTQRLNIYNQSYKDLLYWLYTNMKLYGIQLWQMPIIKLPLGENAKMIMDIVPIPSRNLTAVYNSQQTLIDHYEVVSGNEVKKYKPEEVIVFKYPHPDNPLGWVAPVSKFNFTLDIDFLQNKHRKAELINGAKLGGVLQYPGKVDSEYAEAQQKKFNQNQSGTENVGKIPLLQNGVSFIPNQMNAKEMDFQQSRKDLRDEIMQILEVDKTVMGVTDDVNRANGKSGLENFIVNTIQPFSDTFYTPKLNAFLKNIYGQRFLFDNEYEFETDRTSQLNTLKFYSDSGKFTDNEIREIEGFDSIIDERAETIYRQDFFKPIPETEPIEENEESE